MQELKEALKKACQTSFGVDIDPELIRPEEKFGDYATNVALQLGKHLGKNPREVAEQLTADLKELPMLAKRDVAGPGFINFTLTDRVLFEAVATATTLPKPLSDQEIVLEHTDPNPFKEFHIGHSYSNTIGVAIGKLFQVSGAKVHQVTYQGDVGLHIAMAIYGMKKLHENREGRPLSNIRGGDWPAFVDFGRGYAEGALTYKNDPVAKKEIEHINVQVYSRESTEINELYDEGRKRSLEEFEKIYHRLGSVFEKNYFESDTAEEGMRVVKQNTGKIFEESDGAVIYDGEKAGLHKRVFITNRGLPTYEAKEIGLAFAKERDYPNAQSFVVITANEVDEYFKVLVAAIKEIDKQLGSKIRHLSHGVVRFPEGKMSSRTGKVKTFTDLQSDVEEKVRKLYGEGKDTPETVLGAIKYEFLKHRVGSDFIFDVDESISLQGNSGPYLQYAHARACSILQKAGNATPEQVPEKFDKDERSLARKLSEYPEVVQKATAELMPHHICTYLYELAQTFNSFYESSRIIGNEREALRLGLVKSYQEVLKNGLGLLNIAAPESM
ncbi:arginine--tRNA ligase [Candidatus Saccharibacteria bacterium]|nr:arginine--tRNA ligase [Candidatus Saccharibacteria bacterium]